MPESIQQKLAQLEKRVGPNSKSPLFAQLSREGMLLYLSERAEDGAGRGLVHLYVPNVDAWHAEFFERGVDAPLPQDKPWGNREFRIVDPDGNQLCLCSPLNRRR